MIMKEIPAQMITAEEAVAISLRAGTLTACNRALEIAVEYERQKPPIVDKCEDETFKAACLYATIWEAGRIQGIREERSKKKERARA